VTIICFIFEYFILVTFVASVFDFLNADDILNFVAIYITAVSIAADISIMASHSLIYCIHRQLTMSAHQTPEHFLNERTIFAQTDC